MERFVDAFQTDLGMAACFLLVLAFAILMIG